MHVAHIRKDVGGRKSSASGRLCVFMNSIIRQNLGKIIISAILFFLYFWHSDYFFLAILLYGIGLYLITEKVKSRKIFIALSVVIWALFVLTTGAIIYEKSFLPRGPMYPMDLYTCDFTGEGPCGEIYYEDLSSLNIPSWAKFVRKNEESLCLGLLFAGILISSNIPRKRT